VIVATHNDDLFAVATRCIALKNGSITWNGPVPENVESYMA
jgi:ABC-type thiamine transport system ATPase subunit